MGLIDDQAPVFKSPSLGQQNSYQTQLPVLPDDISTLKLFAHSINKCRIAQTYDHKLYIVRFGEPQSF